jgi:hypothetical protein
MTKFLFSNALDPDSTRPMDPHQEDKQRPQEKKLKNFMLKYAGCSLRRT